MPKTQYAKAEFDKIWTVNDRHNKKRSKEITLSNQCSGNISSGLRLAARQTPGRATARGHVNQLGLFKKGIVKFAGPFTDDHGVTPADIDDELKIFTRYSSPDTRRDPPTR